MQFYPKCLYKVYHKRFTMPYVLQIVENKAIVNKGCHSEVDSYSAFWDNNKLSQTELVRILAKHHVTDVYVCGVAYDVCVGKAMGHTFKSISIFTTQSLSRKPLENFMGKGENAGYQYFLLLTLSQTTNFRLF